MLVTIEFGNGERFGAAFSDTASTDDIVDAVRTTLNQQQELANKDNTPSAEN